MFKCKFCIRSYTSRSSLNNHLKSAKFCISMRDKEDSQGIILIEFRCDECVITFTSKFNLDKHLAKCVKYNIKLLTEKFEIRISHIENNNNILIEQKDKEIDRLNERTKELGLLLASRPVNITNNYSKNEEDTPEPVIEVEPTVEETQISPLILTDEYSLEYRKEDDYVNVTSLCKDKISNWNSLEKSKSFLYDTSMSTGIPVNKLILYDKFIWVHPQAAINIAQWISPNFDSKVIGWIYYIMTSGKSDLVKKNKQLEQVIKTKESRIKLLQDKYCEHQPRVQYEDKFVIYIVATEESKKKGFM